MILDVLRGYVWPSSIASGGLNVGAFGTFDALPDPVGVSWPPSMHLLVRCSASWCGLLHIMAPSLCFLAQFDAPRGPVSLPHGTARLVSCATFDGLEEGSRIREVGIHVRILTTIE